MRLSLIFICNARLSILGMGDTPDFVIKGDVRAFVMREGMEDASAFMIKVDAPLGMCVSLFLEKRT
jgi:hypothetical protein